ncbi:hypothetical protein CBL_00199 [Carabus blaptoides fortunei]
MALDEILVRTCTNVLVPALVLMNSRTAAAGGDEDGVVVDMWECVQTRRYPDSAHLYTAETPTAPAPAATETCHLRSWMSHWHTPLTLSHPSTLQSLTPLATLVQQPFPLPTCLWTLCSNAHNIAGTPAYCCCSSVVLILVQETACYHFTD